MAKVGFGIIGLGNIAPVHAQSINATKSTKLVAVCDLVPGRAKKFVKEHGGDAYENIEEFLARKEWFGTRATTPSPITTCARRIRRIV